MGHLINPTLIRLSINSFWNSSWVLNNKYNYNIMFKQNLFFLNFFEWFFLRKVFTKINLLFSHYTLYITNRNKIFINLFYYWPQLENKVQKNKIQSLILFLKSIAVKNVHKIIELNSVIKQIDYLSKLVILNLYWFLITKYWKFYLSFYKFSSYNFIFNIYNLSFLNISVNNITEYIGLRLKQRYSLNFILRPVLRDLYFRVKKKQIKGYKILCSGRFTRRQIATKMWMREGGVSFNNFSSLIKFSQTKVTLKYGICGVKVWINYGTKFLDSYPHKSFLIYPYLKFFFSKILFNFKPQLQFFFNSWIISFLKLDNLKTLTDKTYIHYIQNKIYIYIFTFVNSYLFKLPDSFKMYTYKFHYDAFLTNKFLTINFKNSLFKHNLYKKSFLYKLKVSQIDYKVTE